MSQTPNLAEAFPQDAPGYVPAMGFLAAPLLYTSSRDLWEL